MMKTVLSTAELEVANRFRFWQEAVCDTFVELDCRPASDRPFFGEIATARVEDVHFSRVRSQDQTVDRTPSRIRRAREEVLLVSLQVSGIGSVCQDGRIATLEPGDFACYDSTRPYTLSFDDDFEQLVLHMPRDLMLKRVGRTEQLTARRVVGRTPFGALVSPFLRQAASIIAEVEPVTASRLSEISLDIVTAALGELLCHQPDGQSWTRTALIYRAKALVEEHLHDVHLNTEKIARALGISPRYLQDLFHEEGITVSDWIWERRLEKSRRDLCDPLLAGKSIAQIALACGFSDFGHFSRRYKAAYAMSPRQHRLAQRVDTASSRREA